MKKSALAPLSKTKFDPVGPTIDDDMNRLVARYGAAAVQKAAKRLAKVKTGRPRINDWRDLAPVISEHARLWLAGGDPFSSVTDYRIAKAHAETFPGHDAHATFTRIQRKLKIKPYGRQWHTLVRAEEISRKEYPYTEHLRAIEALADIQPDIEWWRWWLSMRRSVLEKYRSIFGEPPADATMESIEQLVREGPKVDPAHVFPFTGMFGKRYAAATAPIEGDLILGAKYLGLLSPQKSQE